LISLSKNNVANKYLYFLLTSLPIGGIVTIRESEPLSGCGAKDLERIPLFVEVCTHLKKLLDLEDYFYEQPVEDELIFCINKKQLWQEQYHITVTICDGIEDAYVSFRRYDPKEESETSNC